MARLQPILFFGTPEFAVPTLEALAAAGLAPVRVVTRPARPIGRGRRLQEPAVARAAKALGLEVAQPERITDAAFLADLETLAPGVAVVVAYGQIFPPGLLALPRHGCINLHASLLPRYRGAAPIQAAIAAGDRITGVTTMQMEAGLDSGPILLQEETAIGPRETAGELAPRLAARGAALVVETLSRLDEGALEPRPQDPDLVTHAPRLEKKDGRVSWSETARRIGNRLRAYPPWPGLTAELRDGPVKLLDARPLPAAPAGAGRPEPPPPPGTFLGLRGARLAVACGEGTVLGIATLQRPGRRPLSARDFANGERLEPGERLG